MACGRVTCRVTEGGTLRTTDWPERTAGADPVGAAVGEDTERRCSVGLGVGRTDDGLEGVADRLRRCTDLFSFETYDAGALRNGWGDALDPLALLRRTSLELRTGAVVVARAVGVERTTTRPEPLSAVALRITVDRSTDPVPEPPLVDRTTPRSFEAS